MCVWVGGGGSVFYPPHKKSLWVYLIVLLQGIQWKLRMKDALIASTMRKIIIWAIINCPFLALGDIKSGKH